MLEDIDFSKIEIHLLNADLQLIEKTLCAENGFYLLPIHDKKNYFVKVVSKDDLRFSIFFSYNQYFL